MNKACNHFMLVKTPELAIEYCENCEIVHFHLNFISAKFRPDVFIDLCELLQSSKRQLEYLNFSKANNSNPVDIKFKNIKLN